MRGIKYTAREKEKALKMWLVEKVDVMKVTRIFKCTERSLWRWKAKYDGTTESLQNGSCRPLTPHPNAHTQDEREHIVEILKEHPDITYAEALGELRTKYGYSRTYFGFYRYVVKNGLRPSKEERNHYVPQPYFTPEMLGLKWQMDVKYVPLICNIGEFAEERLYQYTMIDEATRERFLYPYKEKSSASTVDFVKRAILYFGYVPETIQTDNGTEFTNPKHTNEGKVHALDKLLKRLRIDHKLIRPYTPRHNGKVERSHRSDSEGFYKTLRFKTFEELREKMREWNVRYNNRPHSQLLDRNGKRKWWSPIQKRNDLLEILKENREEETEYKVRFIKQKAA